METVLHVMKTNTAMSAPCPTPRVNLSLSRERGVTHDPLTGRVLVSHTDNTEDATSDTELDQNNSQQQDSVNTTLSPVHVTRPGTNQKSGSSLSLASSTQSTEKRKRGIFKQISYNLQYGTFYKVNENQIKIKQ